MATCCSTTLTGFCLSDGTSIGIIVQNGVQTGWINFSTGVTTSGPIPAGTEPCDRCCPTTFTGFCLEDGTPIGIVVQEDEQVGWFNFATTIFSPGPPPTGFGECTDPLDCATDSITVCPPVSGGFLNSSEDSVTVVQEPNVVSAANSTSTPLAAGGTFTGAFEELLPFADFTVLINTDQPSAVDGFIVEYSTNGVDVDATDTFTFMSAAGKQYSFGVNSRYIRIIYVNGATPHTTFRLQTIYKRFRGKPSSHKLDEGVVDDDDAELVKAILTGRREDGLYENVELSTQNSLKVALTDRSSQVLGRIHVDAFVENVSAFPTTIHTVTAGYIFYLMSIGVTAINTSQTVNGRLVIRDNLTVKIPYVVGQATAGTPGPIAIAPAAFLEPIPFSTNVNVQQLAGTDIVSLYIVGYEEPI